MSKKLITIKTIDEVIKHCVSLNISHGFFLLSRLIYKIFLISYTYIISKFFKKIK